MAKKPEPLKIEKIPDTDLKRLTLDPKAVSGSASRPTPSMDFPPTQKARRQ